MACAAPFASSSGWRGSDGRNRFSAGEAIVIEPTFIVYDGDDIAEYVIDCNVTRRNMSTGARAMSTAMVLDADGRRENGRWRRGSVDIGESPNISTWHDALKRSGTIIDFKPDLAQKVAFGEIGMRDAYEQAKAIKDSA